MSPLYSAVGPLHGSPVTDKTHTLEASEDKAARPRGQDTTSADRPSLDSAVWGSSASPSPVVARRVRRTVVDLGRR